MVTEIKIEGMTCGHCVKSVKQALESVEGVKAAEVSLEKGVAVVDSDGASREKLVQAIEEEGYQVTGS